MPYPGIACIVIGIALGGILYYIFGEGNASRYRETNDYYENDYNSGFHHRNMSGGTDIDTCTICLTALRSGRKIVRLVCNHAFHENCINEWKYKSGKKSCPNCRCHID